MAHPPQRYIKSSYESMGADRHDYEPSYAFSPVWDFGAGLHCHDFYEILIHLRGAKYYFIDDQVYQIEPNQMMIVPPFTLHGPVGSYIPINYERAFLYITPAMLKKAGSDVLDLEGFLRKRATRGQHQYLMSQSDALAGTQLLKDMIVGLRDTTPIGQFSNYSRMLSFLQIVCQTVQRSTKEQKPVVVNDAMQEVLTYINEHYTQPLRLETLARQFGISVSYLSHEFGKYTGRSVYDYVLYRRVLQAKEMINSGAPLSEIAYQCGFSDYSSFLRSFKKIAGISPNAYRKKVSDAEMTE